MSKAEVNMYIRKEYLEWMQGYKDTPFVKVLSGMRRVGKSTLLQQFRDWLIQENGVTAEQILFIDLESVEFHRIKEYLQLHEEVKTAFASVVGKKYLFIDEVQEVDGWEKALASLLKTNECDIYITGSNAHLLSSDLATYLAGRYVQMEIYSFSYHEFLAVSGSETHNDELFQNYLTFGGFPGITMLKTDANTRFRALGDLYSSIVLRDIVARYQIRNVGLLENLISFFFDNIGNPVTAKSIADYLKSQRISVTVDTVQTYIGYLSACYAIHRVKRYDLKGKRFLELNEKHYLGDVGLRHALLGYRSGDIGQLLENIVYLELRRRGYSVAVGKTGELEVDFVAEKSGNKVYVQVAYILGSPETRAREFASLKAVPDSFPKFVVTMDLLRQNEDGIRHIFLPDFLLGEYI